MPKDSSEGGWAGRGQSNYLTFFKIITNLRVCLQFNLATLNLLSSTPGGIFLTYFLFRSESLITCLSNLAELHTWIFITLTIASYPRIDGQHLRWLLICSYHKVITTYGVQHHTKAATIVTVMRRVRARARSMLLMSFLRSLSLPPSLSPRSWSWWVPEKKNRIIVAYYYY